MSVAPEDAPDLTLEGLVHDLNNVFETITEAADLLGSDPRQARLAASLHRGVRRGQRILDSIRENSMAAQELEAILENAETFAKDSLQAVRGPGMEFRRRLEPDLHLTGAPSGWERVFVNLFLNAAQAMPEGGAVEVSARTRDGVVEIDVADTGPGIPEHVLPRIFEPHFSTTTQRSGLGLHIVRSMVTANGGTVTAGNREGGAGAVFSIRLPRS